MNISNEEITYSRLVEVLEYKKEGTLIWKINTCQWDRVGKVAGTLSKKGYIKIQIDGKIYQAHRLIWFLINKQWPKEEIDHINHDPADNRIENLREASRSMNTKNMSRDRRNTSGHAGVCLYTRVGKRVGLVNKWIAQIVVDTQHKWLGAYATKAEAIEARKAAEVKYGFHPNHGN